MKSMDITCICNLQILQHQRIFIFFIHTSADACKMFMYIHSCASTVYVLFLKIRFYQVIDEINSNQLLFPISFLILFYSSVRKTNVIYM